MDKRSQSEKKASSLPVQPDDQTSLQAFEPKLDVDDSDFCPTNSIELSKAAELLAKDIPKDSIDVFYQDLKRLISKTIQDHEDQQMATMSESELRKQIQKVVSEASGDEKKKKTDAAFDKAAQKAWDNRGNEDIVDLTPERLAGRRKLQQYTDSDFRDRETGKNVIPFRKDPVAQALKADAEEEKKLRQGSAAGHAPGGEIPWEEIAHMSGFANAPGARQAADKALLKLKLVVDTPGMLEKLEDMQNQAVVDYVKVLQKEEVLDEWEAQDMLAAPEHVKQLDSFRQFFRKYYNRIIKKLAPGQRDVTGYDWRQGPKGGKKAPPTPEELDALFAGGADDDKETE